MPRQFNDGCQSPLHRGLPETQMIRLLNRSILCTTVFLALTWCAFAQAPEKKTIELLGQKIVYLEAGTSGPTVILLHGLGGDSSNWALTIPALAKIHHVFAVDQIGFGASDKPQINYSIQTYVEFLDRFCKKLAIGKTSLVGNSLGGWIAASYTLAHPEVVEKLVIVDGAGFSPKRWNGPPTDRNVMMQLNPSTVEGTKKLMNYILANKSMITDQAAEQMLAQKLKKGDGYTINAIIDAIARGEEFLDGKLGTVKAPTLVVWGKEDLLTPLAMGQAYAEDIKGAELKVIENCGHVPMLEASSKFNQILSGFLAQSGSSAAGK